MRVRFLREAVTALRRNLGLALMIPVAAFAGVALLSWPISLLLFGSGLLREDPVLGRATYSLLQLLLSTMVLSGIGLVWHRRLLAPTNSGAPAISWRHAARRSYGWTLALVLGIALTSAALLGTQGFFWSVVAPLGYSGAIFLKLLIHAVITWLVLRVGLVLPAAAVGRTMGPHRSWTMTAPLAVPLLGTAVLLALVPTFVWAVPWFALLVGLGLQAVLVPLAVTIVAGWASLMLGLSILTTLYGHLVEGRSLNG